jgi:hypothetical protein
MLTMRQEQCNALNSDLRRRYVERVLAHLRQFFPRQSQSMGEPALRAFVDWGIERAASYRIVAERDVCRYIDVMTVFGRQFDTDPACAWAPPILTARYVDPSVKTEILFQEARRQAAARDGGGSSEVRK